MRMRIMNGFYTYYESAHAPFPWFIGHLGNVDNVKKEEAKLRTFVINLYVSPKVVALPGKTSLTVMQV